MSTFIQNLLLINVGIAVVISAFVLLRYLLKSKVHTKILCIIWVLIFLRMLIPIPIEISYGVVENNLFTNAYTVAEDYVYTLVNDPVDNEYTNEDANSTLSENTRSLENSVFVNNSADKINIVALIYACGVAAAILYILISNILFNNKIRKQGIEVELSSAQSQVFADQNTRSLKVILVEDLQSPCLVGVMRPSILLNRKSIANERIKRYSLYHETTHYKNKDNHILILELLACIINWFNPFMWLALSLSKKDREMLCDEYVVKKISEQEMIEYGKSLLFVAQKNEHRLLNVPTTMTRGMKEMKQRIKNLASRKKRRIAISILVAAIIISLVAIVSFTKSDDPKTSSELHEINDLEQLSEYTELFDTARNAKNITILTIYKADIDKDGTDELYTNSYLRNDRLPPVLIECYDLKTNTYSTIVSPIGWTYYLMQFGDKLYILEINEEDVTSDENFRVTELDLINGKLSYKEIDSDLGRNIIDFWTFSTFVSANEKDDNDVELRTQNILDISIYDIFSEEVFIRSYTQEVSEAMDKIMLLFSNIGSTEVEDIDHPYMAVINLKYEGREINTTIFFGDSEYITTIEDGVKVNWKNEGLRNLLIALADGTYTETND